MNLMCSAHTAFPTDDTRAVYVFRLSIVKPCVRLTLDSIFKNHLHYFVVSNRRSSGVISVTFNGSYSTSTTVIPFLLYIYSRPFAL